MPTASKIGALEYFLRLTYYGHASPVDRTLVAEGSEEMVYAGYHSIAPNSGLDLETGDAYSIIVEQKDCDGYAILTSALKNENGSDYYTRIFQETDPWTDGDFYYSKGVVNPGESFIL